MYLTEFLGRQTKAILVAIGVALLGVVIFVDFASGPEFESSVFYLLPISFFTWFLGRRNGLIVSLIGGAIALGIHRANLAHARTAIIYWNPLAWLAVYVFFVLMISELRSLYRRERARSRTDVLTGIPNRRAFFERLQIEKNRARRYDRPLTLAYIDLDHFKEVNDALGHNTGDKLLTVVAKTMTRDVRQPDVVARLGGDEFAVLLPETDGAAAEAALMKLRHSLETAMEQRHWPVAFSIGVVTFQPPPESVQEMISAADKAMYTAKRNGRGRIVMRPSA